MKSSTNPFLRPASALALGAVILLSACSKTDNTGAGTSTAASPSATGSSGMMSAVDSWDNVKDYSYEQRAEFQAKAQAMAAQLEQQTASATGDVSRELAEARDELRTAASEISNATADTWDATKERVGRAWQKAESRIQNVAE